MTRRTVYILAGIAAVFVAVASMCVFRFVYELSGPPRFDGPPVTITACEHRKDETRIRFEVTNPGTEQRSYRLRFRIIDSTGKEISTGSEYTGFVDPGDTDTDAITLRHVGRVGASCTYLGEEP